MDNGYLSGDNLGVVQSSGVDTYIATHKGEKKKWQGNFHWSVQHTI